MYRNVKRQTLVYSHQTVEEQMTDMSDLDRNGLLLKSWAYTHNTSNCKGAERIQMAVEAPTAMKLVEAINALVFDPNFISERQSTV